jgi:glycine/D-amino acid oxidase-like deaminating enzyme/nitrite reductase/ring-hydroxylating ferredoxin subunit
MMTPSTTPLWITTTATTPEPHTAITGDVSVDVAVVGAGITGLTAALALASQGKRVLVIDKDGVGMGETGHTTAHLTEVLDTRYHELIDDFGEETAELVARGSREAIRHIETSARAIGCEFERVPGYLFTRDPEDVAELRKEAEALVAVGAAARFVESAPLPFAIAGAIEIQNQAQLHPRAYVLALANAAAAAGCAIATNTKVDSIEDGTPCRIVTDGGIVTAADVIVAANVPIVNRFFLHTKLAAYRSYVVAGRATRTIARALYWDTADPYHYVRTYDGPDGPMLIVGGEDHKTGQEHDTEERFADVEHWARERFAMDAAMHRWSGQIIETVDGLPFIGRNSASDHTWVATGYSGNGITFGTLAGRILADAILGLANPYAAALEATRIKPIAGAKRYVTENVDFPMHLVGDTLAGADAKSVAEIPRDAGRLVRVRGRLLAVYRDEADRLHAMSSICTHMKCHVKWNGAEKSWDCPCHGGRFDAKGRVLNGPPVSDLEHVDLSTDEGELVAERLAD